MIIATTLSPDVPNETLVLDKGLNRIESSGVLTLTLTPKTPIEKGEYASKEVVLRNAGISVIPAQLFTTFRNVTMLDLSRNQLRVVPDEIGECTQLQYLFLSRNDLRIIPESIGKCVCLEKLFLDENEVLQSIPESIGELRRLTVLDMSTNQLETIPFTLTRCVDLQIVMAAYNKFKTTPAAFVQLKKLKILKYSLPGNPCIVYDMTQEPKY